MHSVTSARATLDAIKAQKRGKLEVKTIQEYHEMVGVKMRRRNS